MKQLTCEMCGSTDLMKDGGVFVCQTCGCKYSVEEARKMMVEGTVEVQGTVKIDRRNEQKQLVDNYLEMCKSAHDALDTAAVVEYSDKILEIDPNNYEAWAYRALSCGWKSSLNDLKTGQVIIAAKKALELAPEERRYDLAAEIYLQGKLQILAHLKSVFSLTSTALLTMSLTMAAKQSEMVAPVMSGWVRLVSEIPYLSSEIMKNEIEDCKQLCEKHTVIIGTASDVYNGKTPYYESMRKLLEPKIATVSKERDEMFARRYEAYWREHAAEKVSLENEKGSLSEKCSSLEETLASLPEVAVAEQLNSKIGALKVDLAFLGLFKGKEKKALQEQIDKLTQDLSATNEAKASAAAPIQHELDSLKKRLEEIEEELTKRR